MTYILHLTTSGWYILRDGREVMGGGLDSLEDGRSACQELNEVMK